MKLTRGRVSKKELILGETRQLARDDLVKLREKRDVSTSAIKRFRDSHRRVARLYALGYRHAQVVEETGYSYSRVSTLYSNPAFQELIAEFRKEVEVGFKEEAASYYRLATSNMIRAERMIADKLEAAEELAEDTNDVDALPTYKELVAISRDAADRFGYGKKQTTVNVNVDFAARMEAAMRRSGKLVDVTPSKADSLSLGAPAPLPLQSVAAPVAQVQPKTMPKPPPSVIGIARRV